MGGLNALDGAAAYLEGLKYDSELEIRTLEPPP